MNQENDNSPPNYDRTTDGRRQLAAAFAFLEESGLLQWNARNFKFESSHEQIFEKKAKALHPRFGRVMLWVLFSAGAEYLAKGAVILTGHFTPLSKDKISLKNTPWTGEWFQEVIGNTAAKLSAPYYLTLGNGQLDGALMQLCGAHPDADRVRAAFKVIADAIRNRDAHAYIKGVRADHHYLTSEFAKAFTALLSCLDPDDVREATHIASHSSIVDNDW
jgi:hypothetical protein